VTAVGTRLFVVLLPVLLFLSFSVSTMSASSTPVLKLSAVRADAGSMVNRGDVSIGEIGADGSANPGSTPPLLYHGGPIMGTTAAGTTIHPLYWAPAGYAYQSGFQSEMDTFIQDVAAGSGQNTNVYNVATQYYQDIGGVVSYFRYDITAGAESDDTDAYPSTGGCTPDSGLGFTACVTTAQIGSELVAYLTAQSLPAGLANQYTVLFPPNVETCFTDSNAAQGGTCSSGNALSGYCAYHTNTNDDGSSLVYSVMPYITYCGATVSTGQQAADTQVSVVSHEGIESITDPVPGTGWLDSSGNEAADMCDGQFTDQTFGTAQFEVQDIFSNADYATNSNSGGCVSTLGAPIPPPPTTTTTIISTTTTTAAVPSTTTSAPVTTTTLLPSITTTTSMSPTTSTTSPTTTTHPKGPVPYASDLSNALHVSGSSVPVRMYCSHAFCRGTLYVSEHPGTSKASVVLGSRAFALRVNHTGWFVVHLNGTGRRVFANVKRHNMMAILNVNTVGASEISYRLLVW
jgi:hypothetical protein